MCLNIVREVIAELKVSIYNTLTLRSSAKFRNLGKKTSEAPRSNRGGNDDGDDELQHNS